MSIFTSAKKNGPARKISAALTALAFMFTSLISPDTFAQPALTVLNLPAPGTLISTTPAYAPALLKGIIIHPENQLLFDFIVDRGDDYLEGEALKEESVKLIKYFLASLTVPEEELWVNLSPYEKDRVIPQNFGETGMGRDLLAQDYILKQLTASLMHPEKEPGATFWDKVYAQAKDRYGIDDIPLNTFNKIWIVPEKAVIYESGQGAFVAKSHLKVMLEEDYFALETAVLKNSAGKRPAVRSTSRELTLVIREILIPEIEKEVNQGKNFAGLRQIYHSLILAAWFKERLKESLLNKVYADQNKTRGVDHEDREINEKIYQQYLAAFQEGAYNYIKEDYDPAAQQVVARKYFSGGTVLKTTEIRETYTDPAELVKKEGPPDLSPSGRAVLITSQQVEFGPGKTGREIKSALDSAMPGGQSSEKRPEARRAPRKSIPFTKTDLNALNLGGVKDIHRSFFSNNDGKKIFVRSDLNTPIKYNKDGTITILEENRIRESLDTLKYILDNNGGIVLGAHLGRPGNALKKLLEENPGLPREEAWKIIRKKLSLEPVMRRLSELLAEEGYHPEIFFDPIWSTTRDVPREVFEKKSKNGKIIFLENLRFNEGEEALSPAQKALGLAQKEHAEFNSPDSQSKIIAARQKFEEAAKSYEELSAAYFDPERISSFVLDGPGVEHNKGQPSVDGAPKTMPRVAGLLVQKELLTILKILPQLEVVITGGSKVSDKIKVIEAMSKQSQVKEITVGGAMAHAFLKAESDREVEEARKSGNKARPIQLGKSIGAEPEEVAIARKYLDNPKIVLPVDVVIAESFRPGAKTRVVSVESLKNGSYLGVLTDAKTDANGTVVEEGFTDLNNWMIVDIGPQSRQNIKEIIAAVPEGRAIMNNGPAGAFELPFASGGTFEILESMDQAAARGIIAAVGGGESGMAVLQKGYENIIVLTGGQSTLKLIELWGDYLRLAGLGALSTLDEIKKSLRPWTGVAVEPFSPADLPAFFKEQANELLEEGLGQDGAMLVAPLVKLLDEHTAEINEMFEKNKSDKFSLSLARSLMDPDWLKYLAKEFWIRPAEGLDETKPSAKADALEHRLRKILEGTRLLARELGRSRDEELAAEIMALPFLESVIKPVDPAEEIDRKFSAAAAFIKARNDLNLVEWTPDNIAGYIRMAYGDLADLDQLLIPFLTELAGRNNGFADKSREYHVGELLDDILKATGPDRNRIISVTTKMLAVLDRKNGFYKTEIRQFIELAVAEKPDLTGSPQKYGGINLNPALLDLQIRRDGNGVPLPVSEQPFDTMRIEGFVPVIINVAPISNLPLLLGLTPDEPRTPEQLARRGVNI